MEQAVEFIGNFMQTRESGRIIFGTKLSRCIFHFVEIFPKLNQYLPQMIAFSEADKRRLAEGMGRIAARNRLLLQTCFPDKALPDKTAQLAKRFNPFLSIGNIRLYIFPVRR